MSITLQHAKRYRANGWSVFPLKKGTKDEPAVKWGEYRERYATDSEIEDWFGTKDHNIGIATGKLSNLTVLDADGVVGIQELVRLKLASPASVITGSGGRQLFYQHSGETNKWTSKDHQGLDSRGEGGYVVAPPSLHPTGMKYRWTGGIVPSSKVLPTWPKGLLESPAQAVGITPVTHGSEPWIIKALAGVSSGERHRTLVRLACYLIPRHHYDIVKQNLLDWNQKNQPPMADDEIIKQLNDLAGRFKKGQYKTTYKAQVQETPHDETLDVSSAADSESYFISQLSSQPLVVPDLALGFPCLDKVTFGIKRGSLFTIGARPGTGKTSLACNVASNLCKAGKRVLYFSTEMSRDELLNKFAAAEGDIPAQRFEDKQFTQQDKDRLVLFAQRFKTYDLHIVRLFRPDQQSVREGIEQYKPDVLIFDHIQHIASGENEYGDISKFTKFLKEIAVQTNIGIVVASQLHRGAALEGVVPELHHLKGCGTIEEESSVVLLMHDDQKKDDRPILCRVAKNRHGKCGDTTILFKADVTRFEDMGVAVS